MSGIMSQSNFKQTVAVIMTLDRRRSRCRLIANTVKISIMLEMTDSLLDVCPFFEYLRCPSVYLKLPPDPQIRINSRRI